MDFKVFFETVSRSLKYSKNRKRLDELESKVALQIKALEKDDLVCMKNVVVLQNKKNPKDVYILNLRNSKNIFKYSNCSGEDVITKQKYLLKVRSRWGILLYSIGDKEFRILNIYDILPFALNANEYVTKKVLRECILNARGLGK